VNAGLPRTTPLGFKEVIAGSGYPTKTETLLELPPPGGGLVTVMGRFPVVEAGMADAGMAAVRCALST